MLCTVAQVFSAGGGRPIVLFTSPFSQGGKQLYTDKLCAHTPVLSSVLLIILVELPHLACINAASVMCLIDSADYIPTCSYV